jgi:hypothetical protein
MAKIKFILSTGQKVKLKGTFTDIKNILTPLVHFSAACAAYENTSVGGLNGGACMVEFMQLDSATVDQEPTEVLEIAHVDLVDSLPELKRARKKLAKKYLGVN